MILAYLSLALVAAACRSSEPASPWETAREDAPPKPDYPDGVIVPSQEVGYLDGSAAVTAGGEAQYVIPLRVPPGRNGMEPQLSLQYGSGTGNGLVGVGWTLTGLSEIARCPRTLASDSTTDGIDWNLNDSYCVDGQKLVVVAYDSTDSSLVYRLERDQFSRVKAFFAGGNIGTPPISFELRNKDGLIQTYRPVLASRSDVDPVAGSVTLAAVTATYVVDRVRDRSGNTVAFEYEESIDPATGAIEHRPASIAYTIGAGDPASAAPRLVKFHYEDRLPFDRPFRFAAGVRHQLSKRLAAVEMYAPDQPDGTTALAWSYHLDYTPSDSTFRTLLASVRLCDRDGACLWSKEMTWNSQQDAGDLSEIAVSNQLLDGAIQTAIGWQTVCYKQPPDQAPLVFDADGDGRDDALMWDRFECIEDPIPETGVWGSLKYRLVLRLSKTGPLSHEVEVGTATRTIVKPETGNHLPYPYIGPRLAGSRPVDIDGDGAFEIYMQREEAGGIIRYALLDWNPTTQSFVELIPWHHEARAEFTDLNGDGLPDLVASVNDEWIVRRNQGPPSFAFGDPEPTGVADTVDDDNPNTLQDCPTVPRAADFDANGRGDLLVPGWPCVPARLISLTDGGALSATAFGLPSGTQHLSMHVVDFNGDGLRDVIHSDPTHGSVVRWNGGRGFLPAEPLSGGPGVVYMGLPLDVNGDGREDLLTVNADAADPSRHDERLYVSMANAAGAAQFFDFLLADNVLDVAPSAEEWKPDAAIHTGDFDGDGTAEIVEIVNNQGSDPSEHSKSLYLRELDIATDLDVLTEVRDEGASHPRDAFVYSRAWSDEPDAQTCAYPQSCVKKGITVVREHRSSQGEALWPAARATWYEYERPRVDLRGRGFLGFGEVRQVELGLQRQRTTTYDNVTRVPTAGREIYPFAGVPKSIVEVSPIFAQPAGAPAAPPATAKALIIEQINTHEARYPTSQSFWVPLSRWTSTESEGNVSIAATRVTVGGTPVVKRTRRASYAHDVWGNTTTTSQVTDGGVTGLKTVTYLNDAGPWLIGLPDRVSERSHDTDDPVPSLRVHDYDYDNAGRLYAVTAEPDHPGTSFWQKIVLDRTTQGLVWRTTTTVATGEAPRVELMVHDPEGVYVDQMRNAAGHWQTQLHDPALGVVVLAEDQNGVITTVQHDGFGRTTHVDPKGGVAVTSSYSAYQPTAGVNAGVILSSKGTDGAESSSTHDELGRVIEERHRGFHGELIASNVRYNLFGEATWLSRPGVGAPASAGVTHAFDTLGRVTRVTGPDGAFTASVHEMFQTTSTSPDGRIKRFVRDLDDRIVEIVEWPVVGSINILKTRLTYGPFDLVERITDDEGNQLKAGYDKLGRRLWIIDPDGGTTSYVHNGFDELERETDALQVPREFAYDAIGRTTSIDDADGTTFFAWDTAPNGIGSLARSESPDGVVVEMEYNDVGLPKGATWTVGFYSGSPEKFRLDNSYDSLGRLEKVSYPEVPGRVRFEVKNEYNAAGYLAERTEVANGASLWRVDGRTVDGSLARATSAKQLVTSLTYHPTTGRPSAYSAALDGGKPLHALTYDHHAGGDLKTRSDSVKGRSEAFAYDGLGRLTSWDLTSTIGGFPPRSTRYSYDDIGNLTQVHVDGALVDQLVYGWNGKPHAAASMNGSSFGYDAAGRQTSGPARTVAYTAFDLPRSVTVAGGKKTQFEYDAAGTRVRKVGPDGTKTIYLGDEYERREQSGAFTHVFYVPGESGPVMQVTYQQSNATESRQHLLVDPLGSVELVLDGSFKELSRRYVEPFGRRTAIDGKPVTPKPEVVALGFTGHEEDVELGLVNMRGRMYDPVQRRFLTPDPYIASPSSGQAYNRYSYVFNNPLRYTDPTGFQTAEPGVESVRLTDPTETRVTVTYIGDAAPPGVPRPPATDSAGAAPPQPGEREIGCTEPIVTASVVEPGGGSGGAPTAVNPYTDGASGAGADPKQGADWTREKAGKAADMGIIIAAGAITFVLAPSAAIGLYAQGGKAGASITAAGAAALATVGPAAPSLIRQFAPYASRTMAGIQVAGQRIAVFFSNPSLRRDALKYAEVVARAKDKLDKDIWGNIARAFKDSKDGPQKILEYARSSERALRQVYGMTLERMSRPGLEALKLVSKGGPNQPDWTRQVCEKVVNVDLTTMKGAATHFFRPYYRSNFIFILY